MLRPAAPAIALGALLAGLALAGCGADATGGGGGGGRSADAAQVRLVVERFAAASARHDYQTICDQLLAQVLVDKVEQIGLPCEVALERGLSGVRDPRLAIRQVSVGPGNALVSVHSTAAGQPPSDDAIRLIVEHGQWRIASLAQPQGTATTPATTGTAATTGTTPPATTATTTTATTTTATTPRRSAPAPRRAHRP